MTAFSEFSKPIQNYISKHFPGATVEEWEHEKKESLNFNITENEKSFVLRVMHECCLLYTSPSPRDLSTSRMPSSA